MPWIVVVESALPLTQQDSCGAWEDMLLGRAYRFAWFDGLNRFYVAPGHLELMDAFRAPANVFDRFVLSGTASATFASKLTREVASLEAELAGAKEGEERIAARLRDAELSARQALQKVEASTIVVEEVRASEMRLSARLEEELEHQAQTRGALDEARQQVTTLQGDLIVQRAKFSEMSSELAHAQADTLKSHQSYVECYDKLVAMTGRYESIAGSRSWRITAPLRALVGLLRRFRLTLRHKLADVARLPRRGAKCMLLIALGHLRSHPAQMAFVARIVSRAPTLNARLRRFSSAHRGSAGGTLAYSTAIVATRPAFNAHSVSLFEITTSAPAEMRDIVHADEPLSSPMALPTIESRLRRSVAGWPLGIRRDV
jgi:hypothetical protein